MEGFRVIEKLDDGSSSVRKTLIEYNNKKCLLREYDKRFMTDRYKSFENAVYIHENGINVPKIYEYGNGYSIIEWIDGVSLDKLLTNEKDSIKYAKLVSNELLRMHSIKPKESMDLYSKYIQSLNKKINRINSLLPHIDLKKLDSYARSNIDVLKGLKSSIVHGDFHPGNIIMSGDKPYMIDLDVCKQSSGIYDLASASVIENYPAFYYNLINNYFNGQIPDDFWKVFNLYSIIYILDYIFYSYRTDGRSVSDSEKLLDGFLVGNRDFKEEIPDWYRREKNYERIKKI